MRAARLLAGSAVALSAVLALSAPALAQDLGDPYGSTTTTTTTTTPGEPASCELSAAAAAPGDVVTATITGMAAGTDVQLQLDGVVVAEGTAPPGPPQGSGELRLAFTVPALAPGPHLVTALGVDATLTCDGQFQVLGPTQVGGNVIERDDPGAPSPGSPGTDVAGRGTDRSGLPRTGIYLGLFLVFALVLLVVGRALLAASRRRRRRAARAARKAALERADQQLADLLGRK